MVYTYSKRKDKPFCRQIKSAGHKHALHLISFKLNQDQIWAAASLIISSLAVM